MGARSSDSQEKNLPELVPCFEAGEFIYALSNNIVTDDVQ